MVSIQTSALFGLLTALGSQACYYSAMNMEAPADYYYRYCNVGCSTLDHSDPIVGECCFPLAAGATAPADCSSVMSSHWQAGTTCPYPSNIGTTDFPTTYQYQSTSNIPSGQAGMSAHDDGACASTVWVTSTATTDCAASSSIDEGMSGIGASFSSSAPPAPSNSEAPPAPSSSEAPPSSSADAIVSCTPCIASSSGGPLVNPSTSCEGSSRPSQGASNPDSWRKRHEEGIPCCPSPSSSAVPSSGMAGVSAEMSTSSSCESALVDTSQGCTGDSCPSQGAAPIYHRDTTTITARAVHATPNVKRMQLAGHHDIPLDKRAKAHGKRQQVVTVQTTVTMTTDNCASSRPSSGMAGVSAVSSGASSGGPLVNPSTSLNPSGQPSQGGLPNGPPNGFTFRKRNNPPQTVTNTVTVTTTTACAHQPSSSGASGGLMCPCTASASGLVVRASTSSGEWQGAAPPRRGYGRYRRTEPSVAMCPCAPSSGGAASSLPSGLPSAPSGLIQGSGACTGVGCPSQGAVNGQRDFVRREPQITARPFVPVPAYQNSSCTTFGCPTATREGKRDIPVESLSSLTQWLWPGMVKRAWDTWGEDKREVLGRALPPLDPSDFLKRNQPTNICTSTTWITTSNCGGTSTAPPAPSPSIDEWCDDDEDEPTSSAIPSSGMAGVSAVVSSSAGPLVSDGDNHGSQGALPEPTADF